MPESAAEYIERKGIAYKMQGREMVLAECPYCGDAKKHFYMDPESGAFFCHKCQERGNLWSFKKHLGDAEERTPAIQPAFKKQAPVVVPETNVADKYHQALLKDQGVKDYLLSRGITMETAARFNLGLRSEKSRWLSIPHYRAGKLVNIKYRSLPPAKKTFRRIPDAESILFNTDCVKGATQLFITEGELDAITLLQAGLQSVVGVTVGAGTFAPEWIDLLVEVPEVVICYDADEAGQKGARELAKRLGYTRCFNLVLPDGMDINEYFQGHTFADFQILVSKSRQFDLPGIVSAGDAMDRLAQIIANGEDKDGITTPWNSVNRLTKGFHSGDLIILSAPAKTGKTTLALNMAVNTALQAHPVLFYCLEMRPERLVKKIVQSDRKTGNITLEDLEAAKYHLAGLPLYLGHNFKKQSLDDVLGLIREAVKRYGLRLVVFDNLHFLIRGIENTNEELGQAVQGFKLLAEEMEIPILAIAQPRKRETGKRDTVMSADDIKGSNAVHADCDQMILMHRKKSKNVETEALDPVTLIRVEAHRYGSGGETLLYFHGEYSRFDMVSP